jgi:hypothetical protein
LRHQHLDDFFCLLQLCLIGKPEQIEQTREHEGGDNPKPGGNAYIDEEVFDFIPAPANQVA